MMRSFVTAIRRFHDLVTRFGFLLSAFALAMILLTYWFEVVARYFFGAPTLWGTSIIAYSLSAAICLATPELARTGGHVAITILKDNLPDRVQVLLTRFVALFSTAVAMTVAYIVWTTMIQQAQSGTSTAAWISIPRYWLTALIFYALAGAALHFLRHAVTIPAAQRAYSTGESE